MISTHTPLAGRNACAALIVCSLAYFYSHAPRGAQLNHANRRRNDAHFYSHAPRGAQPKQLKKYSLLLQFLLTRPSRGATHRCYPQSVRHIISTHTPLAGRNTNYNDIPEAIEISTHTPLAGRNIYSAASAWAASISTHTPLAGRN